MIRLNDKTLEKILLERVPQAYQNSFRKSCSNEQNLVIVPDVWFQEMFSEHPLKIVILNNRVFKLS